ncbi:DUF7373 family lipoprotein [Mycolicibacterium mageritense]|uniref:DUF7373 family lipoprotein n=1 Tax=Mycolicibacterium mageritense TaxID=53462 RepID=UPI0011DBC69A|nr:hypothetical protein [Mycolicibacterium mageritense]TXI51953.1 MAG: hypothetical protein E6Q55_37855 [Mycolicibacterium mageritense]
MILGKTACTATGLVLALICVGCSPIVAGHAHRDPGFTEWTAIPALLNPGNYPTNPLPAFGTAEQDGRNGAVLEGQRLAAYVVGPWEVDPTLVDSIVTETLVLKDARAISALLSDPVQFLAAQHHFIVGFSSNRTSSTPTGWAKALTNSVWEFATPEDAQGAALEISQQAPALRARDPGSSHRVPGDPQALARSRTLDGGTGTVESFTAHGKYVVYNYSRNQNGDIDEAAARITNILDLQLRRIDEFRATDPAQFGSLPVDPTGVLARTLPMPHENLTVQNGVYEPRAALHFEADPVTSAKLFAEAGMRMQGVGAATAVYQTRDETTAKTLFDGIRRRITGSSDYTPLPPMNGLPSAVCTDKVDTNPRSTFQCLLTAGNYVAVVLATRREELLQKAAAQYLMLTAP